MTQHTPGPWWISVSPQDARYPDLHTNLIMSDHTGMECVIAEVDNADANARLIAAAPELLAALEALADLHHAAMGHGKYRSSIAECPKPGCCEAFAAIARAKGSS